MVKEIGQFIVSNKKWIMAFIFGTLGASFGAALSNDRFSDALSRTLDDVHITIGSEKPVIKEVKESSTDSSPDYAHMNYYGRLALADKQEHDRMILQMKQQHELDMARIKNSCEKEEPKDE